MRVNNLQKILDKIDVKLDTIHKETDVRLDNIEKVLLAQEINLRAHMKRTKLLEKRMDTILKEDVEPIKIKVSQVEGIGKFLALLLTLVSIAGGIFAFFST